LGEVFQHTIQNHGFFKKILNFSNTKIYYELVIFNFRKDIMNFKNILLSSTLLALAGCGSTSDIISVSGDSFNVSEYNTVYVADFKNASKGDHTDELVSQKNIKFKDLLIRKISDTKVFEKVSVVPVNGSVKNS
jgi:hypothetical protein